MQSSTWSMTGGLSLVSTLQVSFFFSNSICSYFTLGARYESILMSLPLQAKWEYMHTVEPGSKVILIFLLLKLFLLIKIILIIRSFQEYKLTEILKNPKEWV